MPRRKKKKNNFNWVIAALAVGIFGWIAADFYFNLYRHPQKEIETEIIPAEEKTQDDQLSETVMPETENGFTETNYRDDRYGIEFKYPTVLGDGRCLSPEKSENGFSLGQFYFYAGDENENIENFMDRQLQGMEIEEKENVTVGPAKIPAVKIDYQTPGMGWYGSSVFLRRGQKVFEFGMLANEISENCGGVRDYDDRVYRSVILTLEFAD